METLEVMVANTSGPMQMFLQGTPVYVTGVNRENLNDRRVRVFGKSKSNRYITIWVSFYRLKDFRIETMTPTNPIYTQLAELLRGRADMISRQKSLMNIYAYCHILGLNLPKVQSYQTENAGREFLDRVAG